MTLGEVADLTQLSRRTLAKHVKSGALLGYKFGGTYRFAPADVRLWLARLREDDPALASRAREMPEP